MTGTLRSIFGISLILVLLLLAAAGLNTGVLILYAGFKEQQRVAVERALGAPRWWVAMSRLGRYGLLVIGGCILGTGLAVLGLQAWRRLLAGDLPPHIVIGVDARLVGLCTVLTGMAMLVGSAVPLWRQTHVSVQAVLQESSNAIAGGRTIGRVFRILLFSELVLTTVLLSVSVKSIGALQAIRTESLGMDLSNVEATTYFLPHLTHMSHAAVVALARELPKVARQVPGVESVGIASEDPFQGVLSVNAKSAVGSRVYRGVLKPVSGGYFNTLRMRLIRWKSLQSGRDEWRDNRLRSGRDTRSGVVWRSSTGWAICAAGQYSLSGGWHRRGNRLSWSFAAGCIHSYFGLMVRSHGFAPVSSISAATSKQTDSPARAG